LVRVEPAFSATGKPGTADDELRRRARFSAGVEYIGRAFGAAEPLVWDTGGATLVIGGAAAESLPERAYLAARELWERSSIDLDLPVRIGAHVGRVQIGAYARPTESQDLGLCRVLASAAPEAGALLSEDVALVLREDQRANLAALGTTARGRVPAWVFPAGAAGRKDPKAFAREDDDALWAAFRGYALGRDVRMLRYVGFRLVKKEPPALDIRDVFIAPEVEPRPRRDAGERTRDRSPAARARGAAGRAAHEREGPVAAPELLARHRSMVVLGDPGSGKTTLIRWLAVTAAAGRFSLGSQAGMYERLLPLPVSVGRLAGLRGGGTSVPAAMARYFHDRGVGDERDLEPFLARLSKAGRCLVLFDGLDEVRAEERQAVQDWLLAFAQAHSNNRFIATSRIVGYVGFALPKAIEATIRPFDDAQVERYVRAFTAAYVRWETGGGEGGSADADQLLKSLRASERLLALAENPFMLSALALVHRAEGRLPRHRVQAYELFSRTLCETWAEARRLVAGGSAGTTISYEEEALPILGRLALAMHDRYPTGVAPEAFVVETLAKALEERKNVSGDEARRAARSFLDRAGHEVQILLQRGAGEWGFLHLTFQEFFAAAGLHAQERFEEEAFTHLFDPRWEEVLRLGVGYLTLVQKRPEAARRFVQRVLEWAEPEPQGWMTGLLKKQVPLAALLAAEAGDALPAGLQERIAREIAEWLSHPPSNEASKRYVLDLSLTEFRERLVNALLPHLEAEDPEKRSHAAQALGRLGSPSAVGPLLEMGLDHDDWVRSRAAWALGQIEFEPLLGLLEARLHDERAEVREAAAEAFVWRKSDTSFLPLLAAIGDDAPSVRAAAMGSLMEIAYYLTSDLNAQPALAPLLVAIRDSSWEVRDGAIYLLSLFELKSPEVEVALRSVALHDVDGRIRAGAAFALDEYDPDAALQVMFSVLVGVDDDGRWNLAQAFGRNKGRAPAEERLLLRGLKKSNARARAAAALALGLGEFRSKEAVEALLSSMSDSSPMVREAVVKGLEVGELTDDHDPILVALRDRAATVRIAAAWKMRAGLPMDRDAIQALVVAIHDKDARVRRICVGALSGTRHNEVSQALLAILATDTDAEVRTEAISSLQGHKTRRVRDAFIATLKSDEDASVRRAAADALGKLMSKAAVGPLSAALDDPDPEVREAAAEALGQIDPVAALPRLVEAARNGRIGLDVLWEMSERRGAP
jgi:HEAT repeat protein